MKKILKTIPTALKLYDEKNIPVAVTKVGILPFIKRAQTETVYVMVMKPRAEAKCLGAPAFQIAKGTRRVFINERWCDMREDDLRYADESFHEPLIVTALREGGEEIGLKDSNIKQLFDMGGFSFISASRGLPKPLHMFAAEIVDENDFSEFESTTAEVKWMALDDFTAIGRTDHAKIVADVLTTLKHKNVI